MTTDKHAIQRRYQRVERLYQRLVRSVAEPRSVQSAFPIAVAAIEFVEASEALRAYEAERRDKIMTAMQRRSEELGVPGPYCTCVQAATAYDIGELDPHCPQHGEPASAEEIARIDAAMCRHGHPGYSDMCTENGDD